MPGARTHRWLGAGAGVVWSIATTQIDDPSDQLWFALGAAGGGALGGMIPDAFEPATSPNHREFFHAIIPSTVTILLAAKSYSRAKFRLLAWASEVPHGSARAIRFALVGSLMAIPAGYVSHLAADFCTKRSLPLV